MEEHPIYGFARHYNPKLTDSEIQAKYIDNGQYMKTLEMLRKDSYSDLDPDEFLTRFHAKFEDLSKKKAAPMQDLSGASYSWESGNPKLAAKISAPKTYTSSSGTLTPEALAASKRASQELALQKARQRPNFEKAADLTEYEKAQAEGSILKPEKEYEARLNTLRTDSDNLQRAIEASEARIKEKWGDNWMQDYYARQEAIEDPNYKYDKNEVIKRQQEFEADQFINDRNKFITALEANQKSGEQILKDDKYAYARALEEHDKEKLQKAERAGWANLTLGILQRSAGKFVGSFGEVMNIAENITIGDKKYGTWDKVEDFFIDFQEQTDKIAPRPTKYTRPLYTQTAKTEWNGKKVEVDFVGGKPAVVRDEKGIATDLNPNLLGDLKPKTQYNSKGLIYQTGEVLADAIVQIATTKAIGGTLVKAGMGVKASYAIGVTASTAGQMAGQLYDKGLQMFNGDKRKAAQYAAMTGTAIGLGANLFGLEARLAGGVGLLDDITVAQAARTLTPRMAAAQTATQWVKRVGGTALGETYEETLQQKAIESLTAMTLNGDPEDIDLNEMKGTAVVSFIVGAILGGGSSNFKDSAWVVASENPEEFKKALQEEAAKGKNIDVEAMYNKALKIRALSEIKEVNEDDVSKLDELTELQDKAEKAKAIGAKEQAKIFEEQAISKEKEVFEEKSKDIETRMDQLVDEGVKQMRPRRQALIDSGMTKEEAEDITMKEWLETPQGKEYTSLENGEVIQKPVAEQTEDQSKLDISAVRGGYEGSFVEGKEKIGEGSEHTVYRDGDKVIKVSEPYNAPETYQRRVDDALLISELVGDGSTEVIGYYESKNGTKNPVFSQNFIEGETATEEEAREHLLSKGFEEVNGGFEIVKGNKRYRITDLSDNFIKTKDGMVAIDAGIEEIGTVESAKQKFEQSVDTSIADLNITQEQADALKKTTEASAKNWAKRTGKTEEEFYEKFKPNVSLNTAEIPDDALKQIVGEKADVPTARKNLQIAKRAEGKMTPKAIYLATGWEKVDGKWKYDLPDVEVGTLEGTNKLGDVAKGGILDAYPDAKDIEVTVDPNLKTLGVRQGNKITIRDGSDKSTLIHELQHWVQQKEGFAGGASLDRVSGGMFSELQEAKTKFLESNPNLAKALKGEDVELSEEDVAKLVENKQLLQEYSKTVTDIFNKYRSVVGEVEARNVEARAKMTPAERRLTPISDTEDTKDKIYLQQQEGQTLGAFSTIDGAASAWLFDGATVETLFHEIDPTTGHFGHAVLYDILDNALPEHKAQAEADVKAIEEFLGASDRNWTRDQHEMFVAAGEKYLREGVAPTPELRPVFERLKQWLTDIFNSIKDRIDIDITPEVRQVFDRMYGGKPNTVMAAEAFKSSTDGVVFKNGFFGFKLKESFVRGIKKLWNYTFYRDGNLPDLASRLAQKRLGRIREQIKKTDLSSERLRTMLKGKTEAQIRDINSALQNPNLGKTPLQYSDGTNIEEGILNELVEMRMHVDSLSSTLITEGISTGESAMTILGNLEFYLTQDLTVDFNQDWNKLNGYADAKLGRLDTKIAESEGAEQTEFKIEKLRVLSKKIQFHTANIEKSVRAEEEILRQAGKLPANQSPRRKDIGKAYETGVYKYSDGTDIEPEIVRDLKAMKEISNQIEKGIADLKLLGALNMADMPMYLTRSYQVHWDKDWFDKVQSTEAFTNAVRFFREQKDKEKDDLIALVKFYREKLNSTAPGTSMIPSIENDQGLTEAVSEFYRAKLAKAEQELSEIDMFDPVAEAKASLHQQADKSGSFSSSASLGSSSAGSFAKRKIIPDEIRALWGESKDPILNYMTSVYKIAHIIENRRFIREVVKQGEGKFLHPFPVGDFFAKFPSTADELADYHSTPEIVEAFKIYNQSISQSDPTNVFHRAVDALAYFSGVVKKNLTVFSIASAARNFFYNPFAMIQRGAWNPFSKNVGDAIKYFRKGTEKETLEFYRLGILGDDLISGPLADIRKDYQKRTGQPILPGPIGENTIPKLKEKMEKISSAMATAYAFGDNFYKVIDFYRQREKLAKLYKNKPYEELLVAEQEEIKEMAAERILSEHASYSTLPRGMRILAKQPFIAPFAPHPYEMIRNTKNMFLNQLKDMREGSDYKEGGLSVKQMEFIKTILGQAFIFGGVPIIGGLIRNLMSGMNDDDEEKLRYFLPTYHENSYIIPLKNDKGKVYYLDISGVLPQGHMLGTLNNLSDGRFGPVERADNALSKFMQPFVSADPLSKSIAESFLGYQIDSPERKISIKGEEDWLKTRIWNIAGKKGPGTLNSLMRIHEAMTNPRTDLITSNEIMSLGLGVRVYNVDVVNNFGFAALEIADKLKDTFGEYDRMVRSKAFGKLSPEQQREEKRKTIERETKDYYRFANEFRRVYLAAKTFPEIDQKAIDQKMIRLGLDAYVVRGIMSGKIKEPKFGK